MRGWIGRKKTRYIVENQIPRLSRSGELMGQFDFVFDSSERVRCSLFIEVNVSKIILHFQYHHFCVVHGKNLERKAELPRCLDVTPRPVG